MALSHAYRPRIDGATLGEQITGKLEVLTEAVAHWQSECEYWQDLAIPVPQDVLDGYEYALISLEEWSQYWGFEC
jgi:hypothetical protein